jgi:hypothetical protein
MALEFFGFLAIKPVAMIGFSNLVCIILERSFNAISNSFKGIQYSFR